MSNLITCMIVDDDPFSSNIMADLISATKELHLQSSCASAMEAYNALSEQQPDVLFLDIEMPEISGLEMIKNMDELPVIVIVSAKPEYALESYEYDVTDFLKKPVSKARFLKCLTKVKKVLTPTVVQQEDLFVKSDGKLVKVPVDQILWFESLGNYVSMRTTTAKYTLLSTMKELEAKLSPPDFLRIHRYFIVNSHRITSVEENTALISDKVIPISKSYRKAFYSSLNKL